MQRAGSWFLRVDILAMMHRHRRPLIAGNWKMHLTLQESVDLAKGILGGLGSQHVPEVVLCPPFTALAVISEVLKDGSVRLGAQDLHWEDQGAFTGEVSPRHLKDVGCRHVLVGHSERRQHFGETDAAIHKKVSAALKHQLVPILCIGETLQERQSQRTYKVLEKQIAQALEGFSSMDLVPLVIAYEPVWAIGTGKTATSSQAQEAHVFIRQVVGRLLDKTLGQSMRILYGGSVKAENIDSLMAEPDIDGALVGGESLKLISFLRIINFKGVGGRV